MRKKIKVVGLGPGRADDLTLRAIKALKQGNVILRTQSHGVVSFLEEEGIPYISLDDLYEISQTFQEAYLAMVERILEEAQSQNIVLGVPGHPMIGERLVLELLSKADDGEFDIEIIPGISRAEAALASIGKNQDVQGVKITVASELDVDHIDTSMPLVIQDIDNPLLASDVKLSLLRAYPPGLEVYICKNKDEGTIKCQAIPLHQMDRLEEYDYTTCLYLPALDLTELEEFAFGHLVKIMEILRSPEGCPWDREQTHHSLKQNLLEETYEVLEAIEMEDYDKIIEELGDLLFQIVFHSQIGQEHGEFDIRDVISRVSNKMIDRHPHIFGDLTVKDTDQVLENWEKIKKKEKGQVSHTQVLRDIPSILPALMRAYKVQKKAATVGFDWERIEDAAKKIEEELYELKDAYQGGKEDQIKEELGDLLFSVVNVARFLKVEPELSLKATIEKFIDRFDYIERMATKPLEEMSLEEMDKLWNQAKNSSL
ncbi:MAG: nucleoside triphosphate pyrophosphohydrolase [Clostridiales bacterium]|nr:nucleoside triphosphate pyrophosphohydrolase [Clostridiales bacterium]